MADLSSKTLSEVRQGWLHSIVQSTGAITKLKDNQIANISDGDDNKSTLFLTKGKSVMIGNLTEATPPTTNTLFLESIDDTLTNPTLCVKTHSSANAFQFQVAQDGAGTFLESRRLGTDGSNHLKIRSLVKGSSFDGSPCRGKISLQVENESDSVKTGLYIENNGNQNLVGINTEVPTESLHVYGNLKLTAGVLKQSKRVIYINPASGDDSNSGWSVGTAIAGFSTAMQMVNNMSNTDIHFILLGNDNSSSGNISDAMFGANVQCKLTNCNLTIEGRTHDGLDLSNTDTELDYPHLYFSMDTSGTERKATGFTLENCQVAVKWVRLVTPVYNSSVTDDPSGANDGLFKASPFGGFDIQFSHMRTELGDAPVVSGGYVNTVNINMYRNRIIRTNSGLTYGSAGSFGGQDNSGVASVPVWNGSTHFVNATDAQGKPLGLFSDTHQGSIYVIGDTEVYTGGNAGMFGAFPSTDSSSYSYTDPTSNDQQEKEQNLFYNRSAQYVETTDGSSTGKKPLNFNTNRFDGWYLY